MPRIAGVSTPKYRKHKASGQAIVTLSGADHYLGPFGTVASRREYDRLIRAWYALGGLSPDKRDEFTIVELLDAFALHAKIYYGPERALNRAIIRRSLSACALATVSHGWLTCLSLKLRWLHPFPARVGQRIGLVGSNGEPHRH